MELLGKSAVVTGASRVIGKFGRLFSFGAIGWSQRSTAVCRVGFVGGPRR